jgi:2-oxoglutarate dehydrogenase E1 component
MQVANCTTPANYFHILRRQQKRNFRKPLVLMTPKSLLRHKKCVSSLADMESGSSFHRVLWDDKDARLEGGLKAPKDVRRVVMCSGKVYYDLLDARDAAGLDDVYIMRLEQLYPVPVGPLLAELEPYAHAEMVWCQEEPRNMGAWSFIEPELENVLKTLGAKHTRPVYTGRKAAASTATGMMSRHLQQRDALLQAALIDPVE